MSEQKMTLAQRINAVRERVTYVQKIEADRYKAVSHQMVVAKVRPAMVEFGVLMVPVEVSVLHSERFENAKGTSVYRMQCLTTFCVCSVDDPKDEIQIQVISEGLDYSDKASGKVSTYAEKYALLRLFNLESGEDPDFDRQDYTPELTEEQAAFIRDANRLAREIDADDPDSIILPMLAHFGQTYQRTIKTLLHVPAGVRDDMLTMLVAKADSVKKRKKAQAPTSLIPE